MHSTPYKLPLPIRRLSQNRLHGRPYLTLVFQFYQAIKKMLHNITCNIFTHIYLALCCLSNIDSYSWSWPHPSRLHHQHRIHRMIVSVTVIWPCRRWTISLLVYKNTGKYDRCAQITHWGLVTHICVCKCLHPQLPLKLTGSVTQGSPLVRW